MQSKAFPTLEHGAAKVGFPPFVQALCVMLRQQRRSQKGWEQPLLLSVKEVSSHFSFARELNRSRKGG